MGGKASHSMRIDPSRLPAHTLPLVGKDAHGFTGMSKEISYALFVGVLASQWYLISAAYCRCCIRCVKNQK